MLAQLDKYRAILLADFKYSFGASLVARFENGSMFFANCCFSLESCPIARSLMLDVVHCMELIDLLIYTDSQGCEHPARPFNRPISVFYVICEYGNCTSSCTARSEQGNPLSFASIG